MKKNILYIISICFCLNACSDFLEIEPGQQISITEQLSTKEGVLLSLNGIYRDIEALLSSRLMIYADVQGGNISFTPSTVSYFLEVPSVIENSYDFTDQEDQSDYQGFYADFYDIINQANVLLININEFRFFTTLELNQLQAELLTIRAFAHYQIANYYAQNYNYTEDASHLGIVYNTKPIISGVDFPSRLSINDTYERIKTDLESALNNYSDTQSLFGPNYSYFNKTTTEALYARIALQMNDWQQAFTLSNNVITFSGISLTSKENYVSDWELDEVPVSEIILEFSAPRTSEGDVSSSISEHYSYNSTINYSDYVASQDLLTLYEANDIRLDMFLEVNLTTLVNNIEIEAPYYFTKKFQGNAGTSFIRLSEMYLIRAEANARLNKPDDALLDLNVIRERSNLTILNTTASILDDIFLERRRELAFEGHLLFDIARFKKDIIRDLGCLGTVCNLSYPSNYYVLPIPSSSTDLNENIIQNEGY